MTSASSINLANLDLFQNGAPWAAFEELRKHSPIHWNEEEAPNHGFWSVTKFHDIVKVLRDPETFTSERFTNLEEVAYVELDELLVIDGVDEGTAEELQTRARENLEAQAKAALENARALGADDSLINFEGLTPQMIEVLAKDGVKTLEDFATCADWELAGGWTTENGERHKDEGLLEPFDMSLEEAQHLVMTARVLLGWVDPTELEDEVEGEDLDDVEDEQA